MPVLLDPNVNIHTLLLIIVTSNCRAKQKLPLLCATLFLGYIWCLFHLPLRTRTYQGLNPCSTLGEKGTQTPWPPIPLVLQLHWVKSSIAKYKAEYCSLIILSIYYIYFAAQNLNECLNFLIDN